MLINKFELIDDYIIESKEHIDGIFEGLTSLKQNFFDENIIKILLREVHTLKGSSRMMGFKTTENLAHSIEDVLKAFTENKIELSNKCLQLLFLSLEVLSSCINKIESENSDEIDITLVCDILKKASCGLDFSLDKLLNFINKIEIEDNYSDSEENYNSLKDVKSIRIKIDKINSIIQSFDNLIVREFKIKHQLDLIKDYEQKTGCLEIRKIRKQLEEDFEQLEQSVFETQNNIFDLRMLPLDLILNPLKRNLELEIINSGKNVLFDVPQTDVSVDKIVLEPLSEILLHLIRNALDHGIEFSSERIEKSKNEFGKISLHVKTFSNKIQITISDDGRGIDYEKIREKAIQLMEHRKDEILEMNNKQLSSFIFMSGFSTLSQASIVSGRGVGLDIVKENVEKIKGKIQVESEKDKGTSFIITLPVSLATMQGLFVKCNNMKLLIPTTYIVEIVHATYSDYIKMQDAIMLRIRDQVIPIYNLSSIIETDEKNNSSSNSLNYDSIVVVEYLEQKIGIIVSDVFNTVSVVVKPLPKVFENYNILQGIIFDENYDIVPIINIPDVLLKFSNLLNYDVKKFEVKSQKKKHQILVVDDSITTRQIEKTILQAEGFVVDTATDGIDALNKIKNEVFDAIVTDIKMPRMDGNVLINNIRRMDEYKNIPIIVVSSVNDLNTKEEYYSLGVNAFIVKSDFERGILVSTIKELLNEQ